MSDLPVSFYSLPSKNDFFAGLRPAAAGDPPIVVHMPSFAALVLDAFLDSMREAARAIARGFVRGVEFVRRLLVGLGFLPEGLVAASPVTAIIHPSLGAAPSVWPTVAAEQRAPLGSATPLAAVAPPAAAVAVALDASPAPAPTGLPAGLVDSPGDAARVPAPDVEKPSPGPDLARAWLRATNPLRDVDPSTDEVSWSGLPVGEVRAMLSAAVVARARVCMGMRPGCERDPLHEWLGPVARIAHVDPVERIRWMASLAPVLARHTIHSDRRAEVIEATAGWIRDVDRRDPRAVLGALRAVEDIATSGIDPTGALLEYAGKAWGERAWPTMRAGDAGELLRVVVAQMTAALAHGDGPRARMFARMLVAIGPACHRQAADRLIWFARAVARPIAAAGLDGSAVRDVLTEGVERWFAALPKESTCGAVDVVLEWWDSPLGACTHEAAILRWLATVRPSPDGHLGREPAQLAA